MSMSGLLLEEKDHLTGYNAGGLRQVTKHVLSKLLHKGAGAIWQLLNILRKPACHTKLS